MVDFKDKWYKSREKKKSNIIAGLDPSVFAIGRGEYGLDKETDKLQWSLSYIEAVAPYVAGIKPQKGYFQGKGDHEILTEVVKKAKELDLILISDLKVSDIGSTNDAWFFYEAELGMDAVTVAPYAGNIEGSIESAHKRGIGMIGMGLMSNPEYKTEMNFKHPESGEPLWKERLFRSIEAGVDGMVVGGTYTKEDKAFMDFVQVSEKSDMVYLVPGIGFQGGKIEAFLESGISIERCMISSGREIMFPNGQHSTSEEQGEAAKKLRDTITYE